MKDKLNIYIYIDVRKPIIKQLLSNLLDYIFAK